MGWIREGYEGHEGYVVGYIARDGCSRDSGLYRELCYMPMAATSAIDNQDIGPGVILRIGAACDCGWRSPHQHACDPVEWMPHIVLDSERDHERMATLWSEHIEAEAESEAAKQGARRSA